MKAYYQDEYATIYHGDCRDVLVALPQVDLVFADPPYGTKKAAWDKEFPEWCIGLLLASGNILAITPGDVSFQKCIGLLGDSYKGMMIGHNLNGMTGAGNIGYSNFIPILLAGEWPRLGQTAFDFTVSNGTMPAHPSPKPYAFMRWVINRLTRSMADTVLDPFAGSGTTLRAAKDLGIKSIGIEIEERYCEIAAERMRQSAFNFADPVCATEELWQR